ncbi:polysaccharide lyase [Streptomyces sp. NPDC053542]|uniref:polysaccharide lyase n=1 Tax=Streptomyces sp. NPDC053542 TaxID=3365710 RepID=UPI0037CE5842
MDRRKFVAAGAAALAALLASCSGSDEKPPPRETDDPSAEPSLDWDTAAVARFFGPRLRPREDGSFGLDRAALRHHPVYGPVLRVRYPARSASPTVARRYGRPEGGAQLYLPLRSGPTDSLHLRYYLRFPKGFDFVKGGKLPGLYGGSVTGGRRIPDGENGLSTRYMWRRKGRGEVYAYLPTSVEHGTSLGRGKWKWPTGRWTCVEQAVRLNTPDEDNGSVEVFLDGRRVLREDELKFRTSEKLQIEGVFFSTFFGGSDPSWATPDADYADFAAFAVSHKRIGPIRRD